MEVDKNLAVMVLAGAGVVSGAGGGTIAYSQEKDVKRLEAEAKEMVVEMDRIKEVQQRRQLDSVRAEERTKAQLERLTEAVESLSRQLQQ